MKKRSPPPNATADPQASGAQSQELTVETVGAQGDGVALTGGRKVFIPFTLPDDTISVLITGTKGEVIAIHSPSSDRIPPVCKHFGVCGGCSLQHWRAAAYADWKVGLVKAALAREGLAALIEPLKSYPLASRRRATSAVRRESGEIRLGFNAARSHDLVDLDECPILLPQIASALLQLRAALADALPNRSEAKLHITAAENGVDCNIEAPRLTARGMARLSEKLQAAGIIRVVWNGDVIFLEAAPFVLTGGVKVMLPQGAFLQAVEACETDMAAFVVQALAEAKAPKGPVCDLFAGLGAFTFPCAKQKPVTAFEDNANAVAALNDAAKGASGVKPVRAVRRDLFRNPLGPVELNAYSAAIADPPREGAEAQSKALAASKIGTIVMLSCNPVTFARDAAILLAGGFTLSRVAVFDQFKFSPHVEIAAAFMRAGGKKGRLVQPEASSHPGRGKR
jgi:23S rRNA (uracil1939-C5)-methyltransferase